MTEVWRHELYKLFHITEADNDIITIGATVDTGLEWQAVDECREKVGSDIEVVRERGRIYFNLKVDDFHKVHQMRSIDNVYIVGDVRKFDFPNDSQESDLRVIQSVAQHEMKLEKYLKAWKDITCFPGRMSATLEEWQEEVEQYREEKSKREKEFKESVGRKRGRDPRSAKDGCLLSYRITCDRIGKHLFESSQVANTIGGELQDKYRWIVDLTLYYLEIVCKLEQDIMITHLRVTHESKHHRNIVHFGPTTLRATICYSLVRLAQPKPGDIIIDPMCGGGSIPIEATLAFPDIFVLGGDNHNKAVERAQMNVAALPKCQKIDLFKWSISQLPFKNSFIDIFVIDMPFGKRSGTMSDNRVLYKTYVIELARVVKLKTGRVILLTYDRRSISLALQAAKSLFRITKMVGVNMGGLDAVVYALKRTDLTHEKFTSQLSDKSRKRPLEGTENQKD